MKKGQVSTEYLIIVGISLSILVPSALFLRSYVDKQNDDVVRAYILDIGEKLQYNAENVYGISEGSLVTAEMNFPKNIRKISILGNPGNSEIVIEYELSGAVSDAVLFSKVPVSGAYNLDRTACGTLPCYPSTINSMNDTPGKHQIMFTAKKNYVLINVTR